MSIDRLAKIGIQRELDMDWMCFARRLCSSGVSRSECRTQLYDYLESAPGFESPPSQQTKIYIANLLVKSWLFPEKDVLPLRDAAKELETLSEFKRAVHWSLIGAAYPFWFAVARVVGRLLSLQDKVTQQQIFARLAEQYGDRSTVSRRARYVLRSFVRWDVLKDSGTRGVYEIGVVQTILDQRVAGLLVEAVLRSESKDKIEFGQLALHPSLFPFRMNDFGAEQILSSNPRLTADRYAFNDLLLSTK